MVCGMELRLQFESTEPALVGQISGFHGYSLFSFNTNVSLRPTVNDFKTGKGVNVGKYYAAHRCFV